MRILRWIIIKLFGKKIALKQRTFPKEPSIYDSGLARAAAAICLDNTSAGERGLANLKRLRFDKENIQVVNLDSDTVIYAQKRMKVKGQEKTVKVVCIRGSDVGLNENALDDWVNNFKVGKLFKGDTHTGFAQTAKNLTDSAEFKSFAKQSDGVVYLIAGHSRGGAIAAEIMNYLIKEKKIPERDIFGYSFGAPSTIRGEKGDARIGELIGLHQVENENDKVPALPPKILGWGNRGVVRTISFPGNVVEAHSLKSYLRFV